MTLVFASFKFILIILFLLETFSELNASKILFVHPTLSKSKVIQAQVLGKELVRRGHEVTSVSPFRLDKPMNGYRDIVLDEFFKTLEETGFDPLKKNDVSILISFFIRNLFSYEAYPSFLLLNNANFQKIFHEKFDLIIAEPYLADSVTCLGHHYQSPLIGFYQHGINLFTDKYSGHPSFYSITPNFQLSLSDKMSFKERLLSTVTTLSITSLTSFLTFLENRIKHRFFPNAPSLDECARNFAVHLVSHDESFGYPRPQLPNVINIGGFHTQENQTLPDDLRNILDKATQGVVLVNLGAMLGDMMTSEKLTVFLETFRKMDKLILWERSAQLLQDKPNNVLIRSSLPQIAVLGHQNVKLIISNAEPNNIIEAISQEIPMILLPSFLNRFDYAHKAEENGYGKELDFESLTTNQLLNAVNEVLTNNTFKEKVRERRIMMLEKPVRPMDLAVFWVEYVIKHGGAPHLRSAGQDMNFIQYYMIDVFAFLAAIFIGSILVVVNSIRLIRFLFRKSSVSSVKTDKKPKKS